MRIICLTSLLVFFHADTTVKEPFTVSSTVGILYKAAPEVEIECHRKIPARASLLKTFALDKYKGGRTTVEYSYVMLSETKYILFLCGTVQGIRVTIFDKFRSTIATTEIKNKKEFNAVSLPPTTSGIYYLRFDCHSASQIDGLAMLCFLRR